jgi:hypothetical protein
MSNCKDFVRNVCRVHGKGDKSISDPACRNAKTCPGTSSRPVSNKAKPTDVNTADTEYFEYTAPDIEQDVQYYEQSSGNPWINHVKNYQRSHQNLSFKDALTQAGPSYRQQKY